MRASNSAVRSPANTRCVWLSTQPGSTARPADVDPVVGGRGADARPDPGDPAVVERRARVGEPAELRVVRGQLTDAGRSGHAHAAARRSRRPAAANVAQTCSCTPSPRRPSPPTTTVATSAAVGRRTQPARGSAPGGADVSSRDGDQVGRRADRDPPGLRASPIAACRVVSGRDQFGRGEPAALAGPQPLVVLQRARLRERVDHRVLVAAQRQRRPRRPAPAPGRCRRRGRASVVGQKHAPVPRRAEQRDVFVGQVGARARPSCAAPSAPASASSSVGREAVRRQARLVLGRLLGQVHVQRRDPASAPRHQRQRLPRAPRAPSGSPRRSACSSSARSSATRSSHRPQRCRREKRRCTPAQRLADPARQVAGVEQGEPDPGVAPRPAAAPRPSRIGVRRRPAWCR